jgi:predicted porin
MKKSVLALAVMGAVSGTAFAQTSVTLYGIVDVGIVRDSGSLGDSVLRLHSGIANGSRVGFKGVEDLGGGMTAFFDVQNGFQADTGALGQGGLLFGRQAFVGLGGPIGNVKLGRQYTPIDDLHGAVDPFGNNYAGRLQNVFEQGYVSRVDNDIMYSTPNIAGFDGNVAYGFGEVPGDTSTKRYIGGSVGYTNGPLWLRLATQSTNNGTTAGTNNGSARNTALGAKYDFGSFKLHGAYAISKTDAAGVYSVDARDFMIGATVPFGIDSLMTSYIKRKEHLAAARDADQIAIGYNHMLSKRTTIYAAYARINNKNGAKYLVGTATDNGSNDRGLNLGLRHVF